MFSKVRTEEVGTEEEVEINAYLMRLLDLTLPYAEKSQEMC